MTTPDEPVQVPTATPFRSGPAYPPLCPPDCPQCAQPYPPTRPPDCAECAKLDARDRAEIEAAAEQLLARHDAGCVAEAIQDAYDTDHDDPDGIRFVAAQMLEDGHSPCRCGQIISGGV